MVWNRMWYGVERVSYGIVWYGVDSMVWNRVWYGVETVWYGIECGMVWRQYGME